MQNVSKVLEIYLWIIHFLEKVQAIRQNKDEDLENKKIAR